MTLSIYPKMTRREFMAAAGGTIVSIGLPGIFIKLLDSKWRGIRVASIMDLAEVKKSARFVILEAHAGYTSNIPISEAGKQNVIIAHRFFGKELPQAHGAPVRALVPDRYFYKSAKWLKGIRFSTVDEPGYYERGGWSNTADPWKEERFD